MGQERVPVIKLTMVVYHDKAFEYLISGGVRSVRR
jgi:hypothetical protein